MKTFYIATTVFALVFFFITLFIKRKELNLLDSASETFLTVFLFVLCFIPEVNFAVAAGLTVQCLLEIRNGNGNTM